MKKGKDLKPHIGIFGRRNNGKSTFINALVGHDVAIVSDIAGTTTDPVKKSVEIWFRVFRRYINSKCFQSHMY